MVLESIISPIVAENKGYRLIYIGAIFFVVASTLSLMVFEQYASLLMIFLTALAAVPLMYNIIKYEEEKDLTIESEKLLLKEHSKALKAFMYLFLGVTIAAAMAYIILPADTTATLFSSQTETLTDIRGGVTGMAFMDKINLFQEVFFNNVKVLIAALFFSFIFGAGAIFILTWNASVIGTAIGNFIRGNLATYADLVGLDKIGKYLHIFTVGLTRYVIHGIPEILAYFTGALGGGIISVAVIKHDFGSAKFEHIVLDSADLLLISIGLLFLAAILEVFVTPIIFPPLIA